VQREAIGRGFGGRELTGGGFGDGAGERGGEAFGRARQRRHQGLAEKDSQQQAGQDVPAGTKSGPGHLQLAAGSAAGFPTSPATAGGPGSSRKYCEGDGERRELSIFIHIDQGNENCRMDFTTFFRPCQAA
jgi:hypothetical protein